MDRYLVITSRAGAGFFSHFFQVLGQLHECEKDGTIPIAFFRQNNYYWEKDGWNGSRNPWEYYFKPLAPVSINDVLDLDPTRLERVALTEFDRPEIQPYNLSDESCAPGDKAKFKLPDNLRISNVYPDVVPTDEPARGDQRLQLASLLHRHIEVRPEVLAKVTSFEATYFKGRPVLGLHMRGSEFNIAAHKMSMLPPFFYYREVDRYLSDHANALVFLATDSRDFLKQAKNRYGDRLVAYDVIRSERGLAPHKQYGGGRVGEDVLIDALLLARTDMLIHGISEVPYGALLFAPDLPHIDIYEKYRFWGKLMYLHRLVAKEISHEPRKLVNRLRARRQ